MGTEEGRAFYWRTPARSNRRFPNFDQHLADEGSVMLARWARSAIAILADARVG